MSDWTVIVLLTLLTIETWVSARQLKQLKNKVLKLETDKIINGNSTSGEL